MEHEARLRRGPESSYRMAKEARAPPGGTLRLDRRAKS